MNKNYYKTARYVLNAANHRQLPEDSGIEVAFAGRSNAGKSSVINTLTEQKALARTSKTPGRTQQIVCFQIDEQRRLIDLPGYGYAKVSIQQKQNWGKSLEQYFQSRQALVGLVLIMDIRHPLKEYDRQMIDWCLANQLKLHVLLNKSDKLSKGAAKQQLLSVQQAVPEAVTVQTFSVLKKHGTDELRSILDCWFEFEDQG